MLFRSAYDDLRVSDLEIYRALKAFKRYNVLLCMHCENGDLVDAATEETVKKGVLTPSGHSMAHPAVSEVEAIARFLYIARMAKMPAYVVHLSTKEGLEIIRRVRKNGQVVYAETCPQYLVLSEKLADHAGFRHLHGLQGSSLEAEGESVVRQNAQIA